MPTCCAFSCFNNSESGYKLYRLPVGQRNEERRKQWLLGIRRHNWTPNQNSKLCEVHFAEDQFESHRTDNRRLLKRTAVPLIFSYQPLQKPAKYFLQQDPVDLFVDTKEFEGNDQTPAQTTELEDVYSEIVPVPGLLQEEIETQVTFDECDLIEDSENKIKFLRRKVNFLEKKFRQKEQETENVLKHLSALFTDDQILCLKKGSRKNIEWSDETMEKASQIYFYCNSIGYNYLRKSGYPLPSHRIIQRRVENAILLPGLSNGEV